MTRLRRSRGLPGIGLTTAEQIIEYSQKNVGFKTVEDLRIEALKKNETLRRGRLRGGLREYS
jgi:hypothetical protein